MKIQEVSWVEWEEYLFQSLKELGFVFGLLFFGFCDFWMGVFVFLFQVKRVELICYDVFIRLLRLLRMKMYVKVFL